MSQRHNPRACFDRVGEPVVNTVLFLCSDVASAITSAQYVVDGGRTGTAVL
jgi:enoyl-[acyl-carrier-protein] reductase (NADH)